MLNSNVVSNTLMLRYCKGVRNILVDRSVWKLIQILMNCFENYLDDKEDFISVCVFACVRVGEYICVRVSACMCECVLLKKCKIVYLKTMSTQ